MEKSRELYDISASKCLKFVQLFTMYRCTIFLGNLVRHVEFFKEVNWNFELILICKKLVKKFIKFRFQSNLLNELYQSRICKDYRIDLNSDHLQKQNNK